jgi:hypothetical protein
MDLANSIVASSPVFKSRLYECKNPSFKHDLFASPGKEISQALKDVQMEV